VTATDVTEARVPFYTRAAKTRLSTDHWELTHCKTVTTNNPLTTGPQVFEVTQWVET